MHLWWQASVPLGSFQISSKTCSHPASNGVGSSTDSSRINKNTSLVKNYYFVIVAMKIKYLYVVTKPTYRHCWCSVRCRPAKTPCPQLSIGVNLPHGGNCPSFYFAPVCKNEVTTCVKTIIWNSVELSFIHFNSTYFKLNFCLMWCNVPRSFWLSHLNISVMVS